MCYFSAKHAAVRRISNQRFSELSLYRSPFILLWENFIPNLPQMFPSYQVLVHLDNWLQRRRFFSQKWTNQKQELPVAAMFINGSGRTVQYVQKTFHGCFLPRFSSFGQAVSEDNIFLNRPIRINNCLWWPCLLTDRDKMCNLYRGPSIDTTYQVSVHLVKVILEEKIKM